MPSSVSFGAFVLGFLRPMSSSFALDPFAMKKYSKSSAKRFLWTAESRTIEVFAKLTHHSMWDMVERYKPAHVFPERGESLADTAVTSNQNKLLLLALRHVEQLVGDVVEIGSFRGVTTVCLAAETRKMVYAIDPFAGYGGSELDYVKFRERTCGCMNITHKRTPSGEAAKDFTDGSLSLVFIDAVHDFSNCRFDFNTWSRKLTVGGLMALHDADDFPGVGLTCRCVLGSRLGYTMWGYCPNIMIFRKA